MGNLGLALILGMTELIIFIDHADHLGQFIQLLGFETLGETGTIQTFMVSEYHFFGGVGAVFG